MGFLWLWICLLPFCLGVGGGRWSAALAGLFFSAATLGAALAISDAIGWVTWIVGCIAVAGIAHRAKAQADEERRHREVLAAIRESGTAARNR